MVRQRPFAAVRIDVAVFIGLQRALVFQIGNQRRLLSFWDDEKCLVSKRHHSPFNYAEVPHVGSMVRWSDCLLSDHLQ
jgi:hypothetical protein